MSGPIVSRLVSAMALTLGVISLSCALSGCGDDPTRAAGTLDISAAKAQAARDGQSVDGEAAPKKGGRSRSEGRSGGGGGAAP